jgi:hypothetical protein
MSPSQRLLSTQVNTEEEDEDKYRCLKRDSSQQSRRPRDQDLRLTPRGTETG